MGRSNAELDLLITHENDEIIWEFRAELRLARLFPSDSAAFNDVGFPTEGSLIGVWRWAANLGEARYNFEVPHDQEDFSFLNAFD